MEQKERLNVAWHTTVNGERISLMKVTRVPGEWKKLH